MEIKKPDKPIKGESFIHSIFRHLSFILVTKVLWHREITPNQITIFRTVLVLLSLLLFLSMDWRFFFGVVIFEFAETLDSTDGDIARYKNLKSRLGVWLEIFFDSILTTVWGVMGILFAYISYKIDGNFIYFIIWGLISFAVNLEKSFILSFFPPKNDFKNASHTDIYFGFVGENWKIKIRNFLILSKSWENQWLIFGGLFYVLFEINIFLEIWVWLLMLNQIHWVRLAYKGYKSAKDYS